MAKLLVFFHSGVPILIITKIPLNLKASCEGFFINLEKVTDDSQLGRVLDIIIDGIKQDDLKIIIENIELNTKTKLRDRGLFDNDMCLLDMLELKPNIYGLGINLNNVLMEINKRLLKYINKK